MRRIRPRLPEWPKGITCIPLLFSFLLAGCGLISVRPNLLVSDEVFHHTEKKRAFTSADQLMPFEEPDESAYRLGDGDIVVIEIWDRQELSGQHIIGPDGKVTLPVVGPIRLTDLTREEAAQTVAAALGRYYTVLVVTVRVDQYVSNRVLVLARLCPFEAMSGVHSAEKVRS